MNAIEKVKRIDSAIKETEGLLEKAILAHENSLKCLEIEKAENIELGNEESANDHAIEYAEERKQRVVELRNHIEKLEKMKLK